jgi:hypothetical protein
VNFRSRFPVFEETAGRAHSKNTVSGAIELSQADPVARQ